jgi:hypothetical protein
MTHFSEELRIILNYLATAYRLYPSKQIEETGEINNAISAIAELVKGIVPPNEEHGVRNSEYEDGVVDGINKCRTEMLRRIE